MATAFSVPLAMLRTRLGEPTARRWADATLIDYLSRSERWYASYFAPKSGVKLYRQLDSVTLTANSTTFALSPSGSVPTALSKDFSRLVAVYILWTDGRWIPLSRIDDEDEAVIRNVALTLTGPLIPTYSLQGNNLQVLPAQTSNQTLKIRYIYLPTLQDGSSDNLDDNTPSDALDLLVLRALHFALADGREENAAFEKEHIARIDEELSRLVGREFGARGEHVRRRTSRLLYR